MKKPNTMILHLGSVLVILSNLLAVPVSSHSNNGSFRECLLLNSDNSTAMSEIIYSPKNSSYQAILDFFIQNLRFETPETPKPRYIITPIRESQIQTAIYCAREYGLQMRIRSGGHDFEGTSYVSQLPFFILDMFHFRSVSVDLETQTAWVGAGATLGETYYGIYLKSKTLSFPAGVWPTVCIGGHISGGGYGLLRRKYGLAADNVIDARIIDVEGRILDRESMGEDLFWAIRGGVGSSFAVILAYKLKLVEVPEEVITFSLSRTLEQNATQLVLKWQSVAPKLPVDFLLSVRFARVSSTQTAGGSTIQASFSGLFQRGVDELVSIMDEYFPELGVVKEDCVQIEWIKTYAYLQGISTDNITEFLTSRVPPEKSYFKGKSDFVQTPIPVEGLERIWNLLLNEGPVLSEIDWNPLGGIMDEIPASAIPFPHRAGNSFIVFEGVFWDGTDTKMMEKSLAWLRKLYELMGEYVDNNPRRAYADYIDHDLGINNIFGETSIEEARVWGGPYFRDNFDRLVTVKTMIDPSNFFKNEQSIPPMSIPPMRLPQKWTSEEVKTI